MGEEGLRTSVCGLNSACGIQSTPAVLAHSIFAGSLSALPAPDADWANDEILRSADERGAFSDATGFVASAASSGFVAISTPAQSSLKAASLSFAGSEASVRFVTSSCVGGGESLRPSTNQKHVKILFYESMTIMAEPCLRIGATVDIKIFTR